MRKNEKVQDLISSLINLTKHSLYKWEVVSDYMDKNRNERLRHYLISSNEYYDAFESKKPYLSEFNSYCVKIETGLIYLFSFYDRIDDTYHYILSAQQTSSGEIIELNVDNQYQDILSSLKYHIKSQIDSIDSFVDSIISKGKYIDAE